MSLKLYIGGSGSGKSHGLYRELIAAASAHPEENFFLIVPEQYTLQTQKLITQVHPKHGVMNIDVVSFARLAHRVFEELGVETGRILEDTGKRMVLGKLLLAHEKELMAFRGSVTRSGFCSELKSMISELLAYNIAPEHLQEAAERIREQNPEDMLGGKLSDLALIYTAFRDYIRGHYLTSEEILTVLAPLAKTSAILKNSWLYMDYFTGFTPSQYVLLRELLIHCRGTVMTLTADPACRPYDPGKPYELFYLTKETIWRLNRLCAEIGCVREEDVICPDPGTVGRFRGVPDLAHLQRQLFRVPGNVPYAGQPEHITLFQAKQPDEEADYIASRIRWLVREGGCRYRDIAVITGDLAGYKDVLCRAFDTLEIPYFLDMKRSILDNGLVETIRALVGMCRDGFSYESVFRFLRSAFSGADRDGCDQLESYVRAVGIRGKRAYGTRFTRRTRQIGADRLVEIDRVRQDFYDSVDGVSDALCTRGASIRDRIGAIRTFLQDRHAAERAAAAADALTREGDLSRAMAYEQICDIVSELFEKLETIMGDERVSLQDFADILDAGLKEQELGLIPPGMDAMTVGDIRRSRLSEVKILFFAGVNEGIIPGTAKDSGIINDREKTRLLNMNLELAPTARQMAYYEQYYIYAALTRPSVHLYLSWSAAASSGTALRPSTLIARLCKLFPGLGPEPSDWRTDWRKSLGNKRTAFYRMVEGLGRLPDVPVDDTWKTLYRYFCAGNEAEREKTERMIRAALLAYCETPLSKAAAGALYGSRIRGSVTTLELYASCAYAHFLTYGLRLHEQETHTLGSPDLGQIYHRALELFWKKLREEDISWAQLPEETRLQYVSDCVLQAVTEYMSASLLDSPRQAAMVRRIHRMIDRSTWAIGRQLHAGDFEPAAAELAFDDDSVSQAARVRLEDGSVMRLTGVIDRIDLCEDENGRILVKVTDYKSGKQTLDLTELYYGLSIQLILYMQVADVWVKGRFPDHEVVPAGLLYYHIDDPMLTERDMGDAGEEQDLEPLRLMRLRGSGLLNSDPGVLTHLDHMAGTGAGKSLVIPAEFKKDGSLSQKTQAVSARTMALLASHVFKQLVQTGGGIRQGKIGIHPYRLKTETACQWCPYKSICRFDERLEGYRYRDLTEKSLQDFIPEKAELSPGDAVPAEAKQHGEAHDGLDK